MGLMSIVLTPLIGANNLLGVGHEHVSDEGSRCGVMPVDPVVDILQQPLPLFNGDATL
jgi:hypothetical protein